MRNLGVVKVYITRLMRINGGAILAPYQITRGSLPSISMAKNASNILVSSIRLGTLSISSTTTVEGWFLRGGENKFRQLK